MPGFEGVSQVMTAYLVVIPDLQCQFPIFRLSSQVFLLGTCSPCLSGNTNMLNSGQLSVFFPSSQQHRLYSPSLNHLLHPLLFCTIEEPSSIWVVFQSSTSWGEELSREMSSLLWWDLGCKMTYDTSYSSRNPLWSRKHPPIYLLNKATSISAWEICPIAQLEINKCSKQMGGTIPECTVIQVSAPWLLRGVGSGEQAVMGSAWPAALSFRPRPHAHQRI